jgi:hypothetical protein
MHGDEIVSHVSPRREECQDIPPLEIAADKMLRPVIDDGESSGSWGWP